MGTVVLLPTSNCESLILAQVLDTYVIWMLCACQLKYMFPGGGLTLQLCQAQSIQELRDRIYQQYHSILDDPTVHTN